MWGGALVAHFSGYAHILATDAGSEPGEAVAWGMFGAGMGIIFAGAYIGGQACCSREAAKHLNTTLAVAVVAICLASFTIPVLLVSVSSPEVALFGVGLMVNSVLGGGTLYLNSIAASNLRMRRGFVYVALFMFGLSTLLFSLPLFYGDSSLFGFLRLAFTAAGTVVATLSLSRRTKAVS